MVVRMRNTQKGRKEIIKCLVCGYKASKTYDNFCSTKCSKDYAEYGTINMPMPFVKRLFNHCPNQEQRLMQLKAYAKKHNYREDFVIKRANELSKEIKK